MASVFNDGEELGVDLIKNDGFVIAARNDHDGGTGSLSAILDLEAGDHVFLERPDSVNGNAKYKWLFTSFSGLLI